MGEDCCLDKIQIKNVRSLSDTGLVSLSKVNLLVGENSSGKSTFLRTFPLIKQSLGKRTNGPILWAGDVDDYVDFGSFNEAVTNDESTDMAFSFQFELKEGWRRISRSTEIVDRICREMKHIAKIDNIVYSIKISQDDNREYVSDVSIKINGNHFNFKLQPTPLFGSVYLNGNSIFTVDSEENAFSISRLKDINESIFDYTLPNSSMMFKELVSEFFKGKTQNSDEFISEYKYNPLTDNVLTLIGRLLCQNMKIDDMILLSDEVGQVSTSIQKQYINIIAKLRKMKQYERNKFQNEFMLAFLYNYFSDIEDYISSYFKQVHYIAPLRATAERYYRLRNLAIDEVDYQGKNLAIFLNGLSKRRLEDFQRWTQNYFGFKIVVDKAGGHISVKVSLKNESESVNVSDTGFGYSQILPIITQLWDLSTMRRRSNTRMIPLIIAIEQPELHLHPALQAKLVDAFIASIELAESNHNQVQLILETHSETIVNHFGRMIAKGRLKSNDVSVLLFDRDIETKKTEVKTSHYDEHGYLQNWPIGFFAP